MTTPTAEESRALREDAEAAIASLGPIHGRLLIEGSIGSAESIMDVVGHLRGALDREAAERARAEKAEAERERLALAICGGEDAPGYANAATVEELEAEATRERRAHGGTIDRLMRAEAERDVALAEAERLRAREDAAAHMAEALRRIEATGHGCENARECGLIAFAALTAWDASGGDG